MSKDREAVIVGAARTAIGRFQGTLAGEAAPKLGAAAIRAAVERSGISPDLVEEVIMGCVLPAGVGQAPARQAAMGGGIPETAAAMTINKVCGSGLKAVALGAQAIRAGDQSCMVAGGMENMSLSPYLAPAARTGYRLGHGKLLDSMVHDGLWCAFKDFHMGNTGEIVAEKYGIAREEQDAYAVESHRKAAAAAEAGKFDAEIVPYEVPRRKGDPIVFQTDEAVRPDSSVEALAKLRPAFQKGGTVTAGNAPGVNDAGAALVVMSAAAAEAAGAKPIARIVDYAVGGVAPEWVMMAPVEAVKNLLGKTGLAIHDYDLIELNEAFSVQAMAVVQEIGADPAKVNVNGGAVALGHPIGCSGARILVTLLHAMQDRGAKKGMAALCLGGGNAVAMAVEMD
ncbi:MAG: acetyl-CoA C-acetyltransferase [Gemmatimonadota bacterium]|jgi:acetyl-CoA C-acetyltransferase|nr:acetyl-CoA C-acyltransferase [Gemmatimonadota bacterium]MDP6462150.1 acetyl-CoA C-acetyltransferase [Gemmatimonadota bacterium]MDP6530147.1 acetyl-CoA C-acetyltransferase [Gemmatimonadota bacterium]MDP6803374.1 acetyl-CoA C-acetyltransferase [Gemmatimonadota bacterium]MDP7032768.1 acetyl-CoA C-acetyltransferase [Gemmatimonadota bacterium]